MNDLFLYQNGTRLDLDFLTHKDIDALDLFEATAKDYCAKIDTTFPEKKFLIMRTLFDKFDAVTSN